MTLHEFLQTADQWHELKDPEARAQAFNAGYDNIFFQKYLRNPYQEGSTLHKWFYAGEDMAITLWHRIDGKVMRR
ncbi:MAG: hypothetical protein SFU83_23545 [Meiothermus sp.]|nr:hypothetical protein [Meiothermus sp.]